MNPSRWEVSEDDYYADEEHESNSRLSLFRESVPKYYHTYILKTIPQKQTKLMDVGSAFHLALLQPKQYEKCVVVGPDINKNTNEYKAWKKENEFKLILDPKQQQQIQSMLAGVAANEEALKLLNSPGEAEVALRWLHKPTGIWCKCKMDWYLPDARIIDIKSCSDPNPEEFARSCGQMDYQCQAAFYIDPVRKMTGMEPRFIHIAVGMNPPYECVVYELDQEAIELGREINETSLRSLKDCRDTDSWGSPYANKVNKIGLPRWAFNRSRVAG